MTMFTKFVAVTLVLLLPLWLFFGLILQDWRIGLAIALFLTVLRVWQTNFFGVKR